MMFAYGSITLYGGVTGNLWMPSHVRGCKRLRVNLENERARLTGKPTIRQLLLYLLMEHGGDFQNAKFTCDTVVQFVRTKQEGRRTVKRIREVDLDKFKDVSDLIAEGVFEGDFDVSGDV